RHTRFSRDWSSDVCSSDLIQVRLAIIYVLLILVAVQVIGVYFVRTLESMFLRTSSENMSKQVQLLATFVEPYLLAIQNGDEDVRSEERRGGKEESTRGAEE